MTATLFLNSTGHLLHKTNPNLSYFELSYVFWEHNDSVGRGTAVVGLTIWDFTFQPQPKNGKEVTIAKLGRFKFSVEVAKQFDEELTKSKETGSGGQSGGNGSNNKKSAENTNNKNRKISRKETRETKAEGGSEQQPKSSTSPSKSRKLEKEPSAVAKLPSIHVTNFNAQKVSGAANLGM